MLVCGLGERGVQSGRERFDVGAGLEVLDAQLPEGKVCPPTVLTRCGRNYSGYT